jgi:uncharacterized membrane protein
MPLLLQLGLGTAFIVAPVGVLALMKRVALAGKISPIIVCYAVGIVIGNIGILPEGSAQIQDTLSSVTVALSIPLMLFTADIRRWRRLSGRAGLSMLFAALSVTVVAAVSHLLFRGLIADTPKISGLLVGVYTGGTPNLAAIRTALGVQSSTYIAVHTADIAIGGLYILFLLTVGKPLFGRLLKPFRPAPMPGSMTGGAGATTEGLGQLSGRRSGSVSDEEPVTVPDIARPGKRRDALLAFALSLGVVGVSLAASQLFPSAWETIVVILLLTTISLLAATFTPVVKLRTSFAVGEYLILVFSIVVGAMADVQRVLATSPMIIAVVAFAVFGSLVLHLLLCRAFGVDVDTMLLTSTSAICSPPFVGMVGVAIGNRQLIAAGITTGIVGYAVGNYLGIATSLLLQSLG